MGKVFFKLADLCPDARLNSGKSFARVIDYVP